MTAASFFGSNTYPAARRFTRVQHTINGWTYRQFTDGSQVLHKPGHDCIVVPSDLTDDWARSIPTDALQALHEGLSILLAAIESARHATKQ